MICKQCNKKVNNISRIINDSYGVMCTVDCHNELISVLLTHMDYADVDNFIVDFNTKVEIALS